MNLLAVVILALSGSYSKRDNGIVVLRTRPDIASKEQKRLIALGATEIPKGSTFETPSGDLVIRVSARQTMVVSKESSIMGPIRLSRELFALAKKYGTLKLIPFSELSPPALSCFRRDLITQHSRYDVTAKSSFVLWPLVDQSIILGARKVMNSVGPTSNHTQEELVKRRQDFAKMLDSAPLALARSEAEGRDLWQNWPPQRDGSFYDPWDDLRTNIEIERRALEIFQGWYQFEMDRIDSEMFSYFASDPAWNEATRGRSAKTVDELQKIAPGDYEKVKNHLTGDYDIYGFASPEKALDAFHAAKVSYRFSLRILSGMEGTKESYTFSISQ